MTAKILLYEHKTLNDGTNPVIIQVIHDRKVKRISLGYSCDLKEWNKEASRFRKNYPKHRLHNEVLRKYEVRIDEIFSEFNKLNRPFTLSGFEQKFSNSLQSLSVFDFFDNLINRMADEGREGNRRLYVSTKNALKKFRPDNALMFADIDYKFLQDLEVHLFKNGCYGGGTSVHMRTLRAAINEAIRQNLMPQELYPFATQFNKKGYSISHLKSKYNPRALSAQDMDKLKRFDFKAYPELLTSVKMFLFSYYAKGMSFVDMAHLQWRDIYDGRIRYHRKKSGSYINIKVSEQLNNLLEAFREADSKYVFPILSELHKSPSQVHNRIKKALKTYNFELKLIAKVLDIPVHLTSYVSRHTYANTLKQNNISREIISENLGHSDVATTNFYLNKFDNSVLDAADEVL